MRICGYGKSVVLHHNGKRVADSIFHAGAYELATKIRLWHPTGREVSLYWEEYSTLRFNSQSVHTKLTYILPLSLSFIDSLSSILVLATAKPRKRPIPVSGFR